ncbi:MAG: T9SS type A sorting domain-containing protein [Ignavibacteria bacterium]|nr:T9SS type A sorting domain-containing protein [Ignavibacteria bacterium]
MKNYIKNVLILLCFIIPLNAAVSQIQFFDSVKTVVSSPTYDYKNPVFSKNDDQYGFSNHCWLAYERHSGNASEIVVRKAMYSSYENEIVISNTTNSLNLNPALYNEMIVWQSNARGNWDLYYSIFSGNSWSAPLLLDSSDSNETDPYIRNNSLAPIQYNFTYLTYKRDNSIRFKRYKTSTGVWDNDTLVTDGIYEDLTPHLSKGSFSTQFGVEFLRKLPGGITRLYQRLFYENYTGLPIAWENELELYQPNSQSNLSLSYATSEFLTYSYDTLNNVNILGFETNLFHSKIVITKNVPGKHLLGKGALMGIIIDNLNYYFSAFSVLSKFSDSLFFTFINRPGSFNENPEYKKLYLGDTSLSIKFNVSTPIFNQNFYRIKTVWEQTSGGRTSLVESYLTDFLIGIESNTSGEVNFYLSQNYPNPFNPMTIISYQLANSDFVTLKIFDVLGNEIEVLINEKLNAGEYEIEFDGSDYPSGIYFYRIETDGFVQIKRMMLVK